MERLVAETKEELAKTRTQCEQETLKSESLVDELGREQSRSVVLDAELTEIRKTLEDLQVTASVLEQERDCLKEQFSQSKEAEAVVTQQLNQQVIIVSHSIVFWEVKGWLRGPAVEHWSLADVLSLSCARLVADG